MRLFAGLAVLSLAMLALPPLAQAQERLGDGALGALAGALVAGPVGLVVGAGVGYAAGPQISRGFSGSRRYHGHRRGYAPRYRGRIR
jgi:hypothetical protein